MQPLLLVNSFAKRLEHAGFIRVSASTSAEHTGV